MFTPTGKNNHNAMKEYIRYYWCNLFDTSTDNTTEGSLTSLLNVITISRVVRFTSDTRLRDLLTAI